jgi:hypothetical protein
MSRKEFCSFLETKGELIQPKGVLAYPITLFGIECDDGWLELIAELISELVEAGWTREIMQIKEKFGELCFYAKGLPENGMKIIMKYEARSGSICEICGSNIHVKLRGTDWVKTLCEQCAKAWLSRNNRNVMERLFEEPIFRKGAMVKPPWTMTESEIKEWQVQIQADAREYLFSIGQPLVYEKDGHMVAEYSDGRITIIR